MGQSGVVASATDVIKMRTVVGLLSVIDVDRDEVRTRSPHGECNADGVRARPPYGECDRDEVRARSPYC